MDFGQRRRKEVRVDVEPKLNPTIPPHFPMGYRALVHDLRRCSGTCDNDNRAIIHIQEELIADVPMLKR